MSKFNLNNWVRKSPQPTTILADEHRINASGGGRQWRDMVRTIEGLSPKKLTALDNKGAILRAIDLDKEADEEEAKPSVTSGGGVNSDNELIVFASLLEKAYDKASTAAQPLINNSLDFVERLSNRLSKAEMEIERLRNHNNRLIQQINELQLLPVPGEDGEGNLLMSFAQGMMQSQQTAATPRVVAAVRKDVK